jgi:hypothetical protein
VSYKDTTGFYLKGIGDETKARGSFCNWPKAQELEYVGNIFKIFDTYKGHIEQVRVYQIIAND